MSAILIALLSLTSTEAKEMPVPVPTVQVIVRMPVFIGFHAIGGQPFAVYDITEVTVDGRESQIPWNDLSDENLELKSVTHDPKHNCILKFEYVTKKKEI
jgi:hypothetical protein